MDFYCTNRSGPCRAVRMTAKALGIELNIKLLNLRAGEHLKPEFLKINPQHTVPTLVDGDFALWESRAIMVYLVEKYGKDDTLYPKCPEQQALVNQRLYFDMGTLHQRFAGYYYPQILAKAPADPEKFKGIEQAFEFFNIFLEGQEFAAGDHLTLADISLVATVSTYDTLGFAVNKYPNVDKWFKLMQKVVPGYEIIQKGLEDYKNVLN